MRAEDFPPEFREDAEQMIAADRLRRILVEEKRTMRDSLEFPVRVLNAISLAGSIAIIIVAIAATLG